MTMGTMLQGMKGGSVRGLTDELEIRRLFYTMTANDSTDSVDADGLHALMDSLGLLGTIWDGTGVPQDPQQRIRNVMERYAEGGRITLGAFVKIVARLREIYERLEALCGSAMELMAPPHRVTFDGTSTQHTQYESV